MKKSYMYLLGLIIIMILIVVAYRFDQYMLNRNFILQANTICDPSEENCFMSECSVEEDPNCDTNPYEKVEMKASDAPKCLGEHTCESFSCDNLSQCTITYCSDDIVEDGEVCVEPAALEEN